MVDDRRRRPRALEALARHLVAPQSPKEAQLRLPVRLEGPVQLEVLVGQVGEDGDVIGDAGHTVQGQPVRGGFDDGGAVAGGDHGPQRALEIRRLRRRHVLRVGAPKLPDLELRGGQQAGGNPRRLKHGRGQERGGGLAVRAGDAHHSHLAAGVPVPPGGGDGKGCLAAIDHDLRPGQCGDRPLHDSGRGSLGQRRSHVVVAVDVLARNRDEYEAGPDAPGVVGDPPNGQRAHGRGPGRGRVHRRPGCANGSQPALGLESPYQLAQPAGLLRLGRLDHGGERPLRGRAGGHAPSSAPPSPPPASSAPDRPAASRRPPRTWRMPWRRRPMRSCQAWAVSNANRPAGSSTRSQAPT